MLKMGGVTHLWMWPNIRTRKKHMNTYSPGMPDVLLAATEDLEVNVTRMDNGMND